MRNQLFAAICWTLLSQILFSCNDVEIVSMTSPDSTVRSTIWKDGMEYRISASKNDFTYIENGNLGISIQDMENLYRSIKSVKGPFPKQELVAEKGINDSVVINWNEYLLNFSEGERIEIRIFDQGIAYRYRVDKESASNHILGEKSSWMIPARTRVWYFERNNHWKLKSYAGEWLSTTIEQLTADSERGSVQGKPLVFEFENGTYGLLAESGLFNYSGMRYEVLPGNMLKANFYENEKGFTLEGNVSSPWRLAFVADDLTQLVNLQSIVTSLNPEADTGLFADRSWIKPGRSVWSWWSNSTGTPEIQKQMVDYAKELDFEYVLIDADWELWRNKWDSLADICQYGKDSDVKTWVWKHSNELNFSRDDYVVMQNFMDSLVQVGVAGIKVDFMNGEDKTLIDFDEAVLRHAAKRKLLVNFHGIQTATGEVKRYPNELTREGIRGLELNVHSEGPITASHNAALPFTRFVLGHGDYTPLTFTAVGETTWAHQLATLVLFTSPLQVIAENPEILLKHPAVKDALPLIRQIPTVWDETVVLSGSKIGELAIMARRKGDDWYIGVLNGGERKSVEIDLTTIGTSYENAVLYRDAPTRIPNPISRNFNSRNQHYSEMITPFVMENIQISDNKLLVDVGENGGAVLVLTDKSQVLNN